MAVVMKGGCTVAQVAVGVHLLFQLLELARNDLRASADVVMKDYFMDALAIVPEWVQELVHLELKASVAAVSQVLHSMYAPTV